MAIKQSNLPLSKKIIIITGAVLILVLAGIGILKVQEQGVMKVTRVSPSSNDQKVSVVDSVTFTFNHPLAPDSTKNFTILPHIAGTTSISGKTLTFKPVYSYGYDIIYTATLKDPVSTGGLTGKTVSTSFTPHLLTQENLTKQQIKEMESKTDQILNDPLVGALPVDTLNYRLDFSTAVTTGKITYHAQLNIFNRYPSNAAYTTQYNKDLQRYKNEVLDFIRSKGKDPAKLKITWDPEEVTVPSASSDPAHLD